jgi:hypothetical protein
MSLISEYAISIFMGILLFHITSLYLSSIKLFIFKNYYIFLKGFFLCKGDILFNRLSVLQ